MQCTYKPDLKWLWPSKEEYWIKIKFTLSSFFKYLPKWPYKWFKRNVKSEYVKSESSGDPPETAQSSQGRHLVLFFVDFNQETSFLQLI